MNQRLRFAKELTGPLRIPPGSEVNLSRDHDPASTAGVRRKEADALLAQGAALLAGYQDRLAAQDAYAVLVVLQGLDASGKDGTVKHVTRGANPQGMLISTFKEPSAEELSHDFLWRYQRALPSRGQISIFNRSHYEEVLVVRVHPDLLAAEHLPGPARGPDVWSRRYREINDWERYLVDNGVRIVKIMLNLSRQEQAKRFLKRIRHPDKNWKFSASDIHERAYWDDYQRSFSEMLSKTSTSWAPWHVVPADHKWFARLATAAAIVGELADIDPQYPVPSPADRAMMAQAAAELAAAEGG